MTLQTHTDQRKLEFLFGNEKVRIKRLLHEIKYDEELEARYVDSNCTCPLFEVDLLFVYNSKLDKEILEKFPNFSILYYLYNSATAAQNHVMEELLNVNVIM